MKTTVLVGMLILSLSASKTLCSENHAGRYSETALTNSQVNSAHVEEHLANSVFLLGNDRIDELKLNACVLTISIVKNDDCPLCETGQLDAVTRSTTTIDLREMARNPVSEFRASIIPEAMIMSFRAGTNASLAFTEIGKNVSVREDPRGTVFVDEVAYSRRSEDILEKFEITSRVNYDTRKHEGLVRSLSPNESIVVRKDSDPELPNIINQYASLFCNSKE